MKIIKIYHTRHPPSNQPLWCNQLQTVAMNQRAESVMNFNKSQSPKMQDTWLQLQVSVKFVKKQKTSGKLGIMGMFASVYKESIQNSFVIQENPTKELKHIRNRFFIRTWEYLDLFSMINLYKITSLCALYSTNHNRNLCNTDMQLPVSWIMSALLFPVVYQV